ncbi:uncharacterized protein FOMMEDRAFT_167449 [Fomitiporia mediterranea MF3/22]|uniref:uncharacterized protein n=1 Tax=Fomitiporia mediterranea (strain MF3/22) TaxID=694068 RepID=UPI000440741A|nr:uncharacterized protein FOMMEDRAFT_167449 [Fomitiporia mediterranea MF3/22]EJD04214.1 hypothetical protein FOMMEDRAFT_167449 [Fomitiporia mediterranea MF3/22]
MTSVQIQTLRQGPDVNESLAHATSFLDRSFPSFEHVNSGNVLADAINEARRVSESYSSQLATSQDRVDSLILETSEKAKQQLVTAQELSLLRHSLADELTSLTEELESAATAEGSEPSLLEELEVLHRNLKDLELVKGFVQSIHKALQLSECAIGNVEQLPTSTPLSEASLTDYVLLKQLVQSVKRASQEANDSTGQELKLSSFLSDLEDKTWLRIKDVLSSKLLSSAEGLHWPMPVDYAAATVDTRRAFEGAFGNLLRLQDIGKKLQPENEKSSKEGLYPLQALVRPAAQRFKYHFDGTRQTNRLDKPEWYFAHILNVSHEHRPFMEKVIQRLLQNSKYASINAWREFTRLLFPMISRKLKRSMPTLLPHPPLLAHTVYQALAFDDALREAGFSLANTMDSSKDDHGEWEGTSEIILGNKEWFDSWLEGERKFAEDQYYDILNFHDPWQLSDDSEEAATGTDLLSTISARRIKTLIEQITDRYRALPHFLHRTRFVITVQLPILKLYHTQISETLDGFESLSSYFMRSVPGALPGQMGHRQDGKSTEGVEGARRILKAYISAKWMATVMANWGEDIFFLELWHQICEKSSLRILVADIDTLPNPRTVKDDSTIFDELVALYKKLTERAESMLIRQISGDVETDLKVHLFKQPEKSHESEDVLPSQTLLVPVARLHGHLSSLSKDLPASLAIGLYRQVASHIANHIFHRQVLYRGRSRLSPREGRLFLEEAELWVQACRTAMAPSGLRRVEGPWERLLEAGRLLSLEGEPFHQMVNAVRLGDDKQYQQLAEVIGMTEMNADEVLPVLSVREDFLGS